MFSKSSTGVWLWLWKRATRFTWKRDLGGGYEIPHGCCSTKGFYTKKSTTTHTWSGEAHGIYFIRTSFSVWARRGDTPSRPGSSTKEAVTTTPWVFSLDPGGPLHTTLSGCLPTGSPSLVWSLHPRITGDDHLPHPSDRWSPLLPSGLE